MLKPAEILETSIDVGVKKAGSGFLSLAVLGFLAGAFIAFAAEGSTMAAYNLLADGATFGLGRALAGALFAVGLMLVVLCGGELFTGNMLIIGSVARRRVNVSALLRNWGVVYVFNFAGALFIAWLMSETGLFHSSGDLLGAVTVKIAAGKTGLAWHSAFILGILCNWLVCLGVWLSYATDSMAGKMLGIFFPIWLFVTSGFEHSIANMYYIPAGLFAKLTPDFLNAALSAGVSQSAADGLTWGSFFTANLLPVTLGNIIGGAVFVSMAYTLAYRGGKTKSGEVSKGLQKAQKTDEMHDRTQIG
ncbi:MAG: formate/nitrite transporter family protein [Clostridiales Family XIII bacterium]|jgi:formate/nitrite transporter|nr:formate/nitrite transporter family protein [Clostridiales Family XIII bacterium]